MTDDYIGTEQPVAWRVDAMGGDSVFSDPLRKNTIVSEKYQTEAAARIRKRAYQDAGWVATVTPVYLRWTKAARRKVQLAPFGHEFRKDWKLFPGENHDEAAGGDKTD